MYTIISGTSPLTSTAAAFLKEFPNGDLEEWLDTVAVEGTIRIRTPRCQKDEAVACRIWMAKNVHTGKVRRCTHFSLVPQFEKLQKGESVMVMRS